MRRVTLSGRVRDDSPSLAGPAPWSRQDTGPLGLRRWIRIGVSLDGREWFICRVCGTDAHVRTRTCGDGARSADWRQDGLPRCEDVTAAELRARGAL